VAERLVEVGDEVLALLDAYRHAHQPVGDARGASFSTLSVARVVSAGRVASDSAPPRLPARVNKRTLSRPRSRARPVTLFKSTILRVGLVGDSTRTSRVSFRTAAAKGSGIRGIHEGGLDAPAGQPVGEEGKGAPVKLPLGDEVIAFHQGRGEDAGHGRHARAEDQPLLRSLESREPGFGRGVSGIAVAGVIPVGGPQAELVLEAFRGEGRRLEDRIPTS
jgi:hypothetical protein